MQYGKHAAAAEYPQTGDRWCCRGNLQFDV
jgi:hypothetical protein